MLHGRKRPRRATATRRRARTAKLPFGPEQVAVPAFTGRRVLASYPLAEIARYIDWTFFFHAWELRGKFPAILQHPERGEAARELFADAQELLARIIEDGSLTANAVYGFWPAASEDDTIVLYEDASQAPRGRALPDAAPAAEARRRARRGCRSRTSSRRMESGVIDYVGAFAVTAGIGTEALAAKFEAQNDDYSAIMVKALADRLAEAFAELLHARARADWGYGRERDASATTS